MNYKALGTLERSSHIEGNRWVILVKWGSEWVVSQYIDGCAEWCNGNYFRAKSGAEECFSRKLREYRRRAEQPC